MKFPRVHTLQEIAAIIKTSYVGDDSFPVHGMNEIHVVEAGDIVFVDHPKYYDKALESKATIVLINKEVACPEGKALLLSDDPFRDFNTLTDHFRPFVSASASVSASARIGERTIIQPNCFIGNNVTIGNDCIIHANVAIYDNTIIGNNVTIHSGTVLGSDAFYYKKRPEGFDKLRSGGRVILEDNVDLGSLCTIDKGVTGDTTIKEGTQMVSTREEVSARELDANTKVAGRASPPARQSFPNTTTPTAGGILSPPLPRAPLPGLSDRDCV